MSYQTKIITTENVIDQVKQLFSAGYRFVTATCVDERDKFRVIYSFDKDITLVNLEVEAGKNEEIPSISGVYLCAFLIENEMKTPWRKVPPQHAAPKRHAPKAAPAVPKKAPEAAAQSQPEGEKQNG